MRRAVRAWSMGSLPIMAWEQRRSPIQATNWLTLTCFRTSSRTRGMASTGVPVGLYQPDFATPEQGAMLWVYEGMTQYLGNVLAARSGLKSQAEYRDLLALSAAELDYTPGRQWRPTEDTAVAASILRAPSAAWDNWRRSQDYYDEGELLWLDADTLIRKTTNNKKSLNDFEHIFLGKGGNTGPLIVPYTFDELVADLNEVMPYDLGYAFCTTGSTRSTCTPISPGSNRADTSWSTKTSRAKDQRRCRQTRADMAEG